MYTWARLHMCVYHVHTKVEQNLWIVIILYQTSLVMSIISAKNYLKKTTFNIQKLAFMVDKHIFICKIKSKYIQNGFS